MPPAGGAVIADGWRWRWWRRDIITLVLGKGKEGLGGNAHAEALVVEVAEAQEEAWAATKLTRRPNNRVVEDGPKSHGGPWNPRGCFRHHS